MKTKIEYDKEADAIYILLSDAKYSYGANLDHERRIDFAEDGTPVGIELLCVSEGVNLDDLPEQAQIVGFLEGKHIKAIV